MKRIPISKVNELCLKWFTADAIMVITVCFLMFLNKTLATILLIVALVSIISGLLFVYKYNRCPYCGTFKPGKLKCKHCNKKLD